MPGLYNPKKWENPRPCRGPGAPMGVGVLRVPETQPPTPSPVPATVTDGRTLRYCTYSAGFTQLPVSRNPWSQCFGHIGYCTYPSHTCNTREAGKRPSLKEKRQRQQGLPVWVRYQLTPGCAGYRSREQVSGQVRCRPALLSAIGQTPSASSAMPAARLRKSATAEKKAMAASTTRRENTSAMNE